MLYRTSFRVSQRAHRVCISKSDRLMLFSDIPVFVGIIRTNKCTMWGGMVNAESLVLELATTPTATTVL